MENKKNTIGLVGFILSIVSIVTCGFTSIIGLILSILGLNESKKCNNDKKGMSIAGIVISAVMLFIFSIVLLVAIGNGDNTSTSSTSTSNGKNVVDKQEETIEYIKVSVDDLEDALEANAAAAKDTYNKKYVEVTGKLGTIDSDLKYIGLDSTTKEWDLYGIHCTIKNNEQREIVKTLTKDQEITIRGKITDVGEVLGYYLDITEIIQN